MNFIEKLNKAWEKNNSLLCVGLDPDQERFPTVLQGQKDAIYSFCKAIVDETADLVCAFKPQIAYFHAARAEDQLEAICHYIKKTYPDIPVILDAKRGDIGATATQYAKEAYERYDADAVTLSPFMGFDSIEPYLAYPEKGAIILCRTSNPGGSDLQFLTVDGKPLYQHIAKMVAEKWNKNGQCALVVGATFPEEIEKVRSLVGDIPLLIPGIGAQGGNVEQTVKAGKTASGTGMMINSSRAIIYAGKDKNFAKDSRQTAIQTRDQINKYR